MTIKRRMFTDTLVRAVFGLILIAALFVAKTGHAESNDGAVKIGVLNDQSGVYADFGGHAGNQPADFTCESLVHCAPSSEVCSFC